MKVFFGAKTRYRYRPERMAGVFPLITAVLGWEIGRRWMETSKEVTVSQSCGWGALECVPQVNHRVRTRRHVDLLGFVRSVTFTHVRYVYQVLRHN